MLCPLCQFDNPANTARCRSCGAALKVSAQSATPDALPDGTLLAGAYAVEGVLGQGGFGITYRCHDRMLDRRVAVKEFFPSGCRREQTDVSPSRGLTDANYSEARAQFLAEARLLARCRHAGIVSVYAAFEANQTAYMVMELLHGQSLGQLLSARGGRMGEAEALGIIEPIGAALGFVHGLDLLHRDIKPDNIMVCDDGRMMLIDFGTAREFIKDQAQGHTVVVTPGYAPLEQYAKQAKRGAFTDIYSLAATLYHLLTGQMPPAASDRAMGVILRPVHEENPNVSASVARAVESGLAMEIARRPQSVREFSDLLKAPVGDEVEENHSLAKPTAESLPLPEAVIANYPGALKARQQLSEGVLPDATSPATDSRVAVSSPVKLAPQRALPPTANPPKAAPISRGASGNVSVKNASDSDASTKLGWILFASFVGILAFASLVGSGNSGRNTAPPKGVRDYRNRDVNSSASSYNGSSSASPEMRMRMRLRMREYEDERRQGQRVWDALPLLPPASIENLPLNGKTGATDSENKYLSRRDVVKFSHDGRRLAYVDEDAVLKVVSVPERRVIRSLKLGKTRTSVRSMFSPDNGTIAVTRTGRLDGESRLEAESQVEVWSLGTGKRLGTFVTDANEKRVELEAVTNDSKLLLRTSPSEGYKEELFLWNAKTGTRAEPPFPHVNNWSVSAMAPDSKEMIVGDGSGHLRWLELPTGKEKAQRLNNMTQADYDALFGNGPFGIPDEMIKSSGAQPLGVRDIEYALNGAYIAHRNAANIYVIDSKAKPVGSLTFSAQHETLLALSPDGKWVAANGALPYGPPGALLWDVKNEQKIRLQDSYSQMADFSFSPDAKQLYGVRKADGKLQFLTWNVDAKKVASFAESKQSSFPLGSMTNGRSIFPLAQSESAIALSTVDSIEIRSPQGRLTRKLEGQTFGVQAMRFSPDGRLLVARRGDSFDATIGPIGIWDVKTGQSLLQIPALQRPSRPTKGKNTLSKEETSQLHVEQLNSRNLAFSPDNKLFACARPNGDTFAVELWSLDDSPRRITSFAQSEPVISLAFSPAGNYLFCGGEKGLLQSYDVKTRQLQDRTRVGEAVVDLVFTSSDLVVLGSTKTTLYRLPPTTDFQFTRKSEIKIPLFYKAERDPITQWAFSPDGKFLVKTTFPQGIQIWQLPGGSLLQTLQTNVFGSEWISGVDFSKDSSELTVVKKASANSNGVITTYSRVKAK